MNKVNLKKPDRRVKLKKEVPTNKNTVEYYHNELNNLSSDSYYNKYNIDDNIYYDEDSDIDDLLDDIYYDEDSDIDDLLNDIYYDEDSDIDDFDYDIYCDDNYIVDYPANDFYSNNDKNIVNSNNRAETSIIEKIIIKCLDIILNDSFLLIFFFYFHFFY